jgi:hypothetical protein
MNKKFYIVYKILNLLNGKIYIGAHMTRNIEDRYMGSGVEIKRELKTIGKKHFRKEILFFFDTKEEMLSKEKELVTKEFCLREDTYNRNEGGGSYNAIGMVPVKDSNGNNLLVYREDPRYIAGELKHNQVGNKYNIGKVRVKDKHGNIFVVNTDDERFINGELVGLRKGCKGIPSFAGKKHTEEFKKKISAINSQKQKGENNSQYGTCWITNYIQNKKIKVSELPTWLNDGWKRGRLKLDV